MYHIIVPKQNAISTRFQDIWILTRTVILKPAVTFKKIIFKNFPMFSLTV